MSMIVRIGLAAAVSLAVVSNATAQKASSKPHVKPFTAEEQLYFDRASHRANGPFGGDSGGGGGGDGGGGM